MRLNDIIIESVKSSYDQGGKSWYELQDAKALAKKDGKNPDILSYGELSSYIEKAKKIRKDEDKQRLDPKCWKGYKKQGTKMKGGVRVNNCVKEAKQALARHVKEGVPLPDSLFRYQSEAYFDTFKYAKQLREAGILQELDWESEEMLGTDIGESVELKGVGRVWLDVPYLEEADADDGMIGEPAGLTTENTKDPESKGDCEYCLGSGMITGGKTCPRCDGDGEEPGFGGTKAYESNDENEALIAKVLAKALGDKRRAGEDPYSLFAELESENHQTADMIALMEKMIYGIKLQERAYKDVGVADVVKDRRGKEFKFYKYSKQFK